MCVWLYLSHCFSNLMNHNIIFFKYKESELKNTLGSVAPGKLVLSLFFLVSLFPPCERARDFKPHFPNIFPNCPNLNPKIQPGPGNKAISSWGIASGCCISALIWRESRYSYKNKQLSSLSSWSLFPLQHSQGLCWLRRSLGFCFFVFFLSGYLSIRNFVLDEAPINFA